MDKMEVIFHKTATYVSAVCRICLARNVECLTERKIFMLFDPCLSLHSIH